MPTELWMLSGAVLLGLIHIMAQSIAFTKQVGARYNVSARDEEHKPTGVAARLQRAHVNFSETFPLFAAVVLALHATGKTNHWSALGAVAYLIGRVIYLPLYAAGVPWVRTVAWLLATAGIFLALLQLLIC